MSSKYSNDRKVYAFSASDMRIMEFIKSRLYDYRPLGFGNGDQRRDLANTLDAIMHRAMELDDDDS